MRAPTRKVTAPAPKPTPAPAHKPVPAALTPQQKGRAALTTLRPYPLDRIYGAGWTIHYLPARAGYRGMTDFATSRIDVYINSDQSVAFTARVLAHEIGHVIDVQWGTAASRRQYLKLRGINPDAQWYGCSGCNDFTTPAGDFAEVVARYLTGNTDFLSRETSKPQARGCLTCGGSGGQGGVEPPAF